MLAIASAGNYDGVMTSQQVVLYTIGYQGRSMAGFIRTLQEAGVEKVVDVRLNPVSRDKRFNMMKLFQELNRSGISYESVRELGNPHDIRALWQNGELERGRRQYRTFVNNGAAAHVDYLIGLARLGVTAILCRESDSHECHRSVIAEVAQERDTTIRVVDL
jgi:uncharacterized protein (DUF488 family)